MNHKQFPYLTIFFILAAGVLTLLYIYFPDYFLEDNIIENIQGILLLSASIIIFFNIRRKTWFKYRPFCIVAFIGCIFLFMEEISYGQRLLRISTPDFFSQFNDSKEINLHNINDGVMEVCLYTLILLWAFVSLFNFKFYIKVLMARWIPIYHTEINILAILLVILTQMSYSISNSFPEAFELLWYIFFLILFLSNPLKRIENINS